jgi:hypothetical protein
MDEERFQQMEKRLNEQAEATRAMNETLNKFLAVMANQEAARNIIPPPPVPTQLVTTPLQASQPSRVKPGVPSHFDGDRAQGRAFLTSCELYISLTQSDFVDEQVRIHWALSYLKGRRAASFAERILRQELRSGKMCFASWHDFTEEFAVTFCPENEATTALMRLESDRYYQGKQNVEAYIDEFKDLINLSGYTDPIAIVLKFCRGLNQMTQDRIAESGTDSPGDMDFNGWFKAARHLDLNHLANEAFHLASRRPPIHSAPIPTTYAPPPCTPFSFARSHPPTAAIPAAMHTPSRALPLGIPMDVDRTRTFKPLAQTCYRCGQTGHISKECDLRHDLCHMMLDEEHHFIQRIMANCDAAVAAAAESTTYTATSEGTLVEREIEDADFVRSSR